MQFAINPELILICKGEDKLFLIDSTVSSQYFVASGLHAKVAVAIYLNKQITIDDQKTYDQILNLLLELKIAQPKVNGRNHTITDNSLKIFLDKPNLELGGIEVLEFETFGEEIMIYAASSS